MTWTWSEPFLWEKHGIAKDFKESGSSGTQTPRLPTKGYLGLENSKTAKGHFVIHYSVALLTPPPLLMLLASKSFSSSLSSVTASNLQSHSNATSNMKLTNNTHGSPFQRVSDPYLSILVSVNWDANFTRVKSRKHLVMSLENDEHMLGAPWKVHWLINTSILGVSFPVRVSQAVLSKATICTFRKGLPGLHRSPCCSFTTDPMHPSMVRQTKRSSILAGGRIALFSLLSHSWHCSLLRTDTFVKPNKHKCDQKTADNEIQGKPIIQECLLTVKQ